MMPRGFRPVGWVAAVGGAALGCYMLSLNVAAERAEVAKLERRILLAKQDIRSLQTELGTRGRLQQLEHWNAEVLALSAPVSSQFLDNPVTLARFDRTEKTIEEKARVRMASAEAGPPAVVQAQPPIAPVRKLPPVEYAVATERSVSPSQPLLRQASYTTAEVKPVLAVVKADRKPAVKPIAKDEPRKPEVGKAETGKSGAKLSSLKTVVAQLGDDKPAARASGAKAKGEAGLR